MFELYENIKRLRLEQELTQTELAHMVGYSDKSMIAKIENGKVDLPMSKVELFADALGVEPVELMGDEWVSSILDNARLDLIEHFNGDPVKIAEFYLAEAKDREAELREARRLKPHTIAAHHDDEEWTKEELDEIEMFKNYVKSKRDKAK